MDTQSLLKGGDIPLPPLYDTLITAKAFLISPHNNYKFHCNAVNNPTSCQQTSECYQWRGGWNNLTLFMP